MPRGLGTLSRMKALGGWIFTILGATALAVVAWWLMQEDAGGGEGGPGFDFVLPVTLTRVEVRDVKPRARLTGTVRAARKAGLAFDTSGLVETIEVSEGDMVAAGQVLARLGRRDEELDLDTAKASLVRAEREFELLEAGERVEVIRRLEAELEAAKATTELALLEVDRGKKLLEERVISQSEQDARATAYRAAVQRQVAAYELHAQAIAGTRPEDLAIASAKLSEAKTFLATTAHELEKTILVAPWAGVVTARNLSVGDYASAGTVVFEIVDLDHLEVHVEVPGSFAARTGTGAQVVLSLSGQAGFSLATALDTTIPAADERSRSFRGIVRLGPDEVKDGILRPGMFVQVELLLASFPGALAVPTDCILVSERGTVVVRALDAPPPPGGDAAPGDAAAGHGPPPPAHVAEFVPVRVLAEADGFSAVESIGQPLVAGDAIVLTGADNAYPGAALNVAAAPGEDRE